jgi:hypothetical protein
MAKTLKQRNSGWLHKERRSCQCGLQLPKRSHHTRCSTCRKNLQGFTISSWGTVEQHRKCIANLDKRWAAQKAATA